METEFLMNTRTEFLKGSTELTKEEAANTEELDLDFPLQGTL